ncbi:MAG: hypothetical protein CL912_31965 [Deltaproteobacteria bacterium]|nr:hypothetical protein [Deltaproteobacteria bacterium]|tara:strand:- start:774 stop:962 length:189 start_codon:yes stop_codon:yes gene_type:complete
MGKAKSIDRLAKLLNHENFDLLSYLKLVSATPTSLLRVLQIPAGGTALEVLASDDHDVEAHR